ncbi:MAG TPA: hypothetical protein VMT71_00935 [Syntrophorhabdales bacterium]|nr:hypothetical protein [Syntrophorhabdales bacterium]
MNNTYFVIEFGVHVPEDSLSSIITGIGAYGNVSANSQPNQYEVEVLRKSNVLKLKQRLLEWERYGFLKWHIEEK